MAARMARNIEPLAASSNSRKVTGRAWREVGHLCAEDSGFENLPELFGVQGMTGARDDPAGLAGQVPALRSHPALWLCRPNVLRTTTLRLPLPFDAARLT